ncbi:MAG: D-alanyl-D-alanine carboxypeptidase, partial [Umezawaea sp.]
GVLNTVQVTDAEGYARTAFVDALRRAGVEVDVEATGPNPVDLLPAKDGYRAEDQVAQLRSAPFSEYAKLILKMSHNLGADTDMCLLAVHRASTNCEDGVAAVGEFLRAHGVDGGGFSFADGRGGAAGDLTTPTAATALLRYWTTRPDYQRLKDALPILGVDGTIGGDEKDSPARGRVFAKTGTVAGGDLANQRVTVQAETLVGFADAADGRQLAFAVYVGDLGVPDVADILDVAADLSHIAALVQQRR